VIGRLDGTLMHVINILVNKAIDIMHRDADQHLVKHQLIQSPFRCSRILFGSTYTKRYFSPLSPSFNRGTFSWVRKRSKLDFPDTAHANDQAGVTCVESSQDLVNLPGAECNWKCVGSHRDQPHGVGMGGMRSK